MCLLATSNNCSLYFRMCHVSEIHKIQLFVLSLLAQRVDGHSLVACSFEIHKANINCDSQKALQFLVNLEFLMDFNNFYIFGNRNECPLQTSYLLIYFTCDINMTSMSCNPK